MGRASRKRAEQRASPPPSVAAPEARLRRLTYAQGRELQALKSLAELRRQLDADIDRTVLRLEALGVNWGAIGRALGISRQAARQRYGG